ncbi:hypothetical protein [Persicobacter psychrovividus]|uniref:Glucose-1-phosphate thymidylyltransferase n=1 Tax=Persicobacter psychrovividus TaxID=387638 RepID=A0ABM7VL76_9BACT|nr:glucose-1-phosphate thymidylyltransferase [Persicobacter psychrovividus]
MRSTDFFDLSKSMIGPYLKEQSVFEVLANLPEIILELINQLPPDFHHIGHQVWVEEGVMIDEHVKMTGPAIIGRGTEIRHGALLRPNVIIGRGCVVGNSSEIKHAILFDGAQAPHFNYIGDGIMGYKAHLGAGAIMSNFRSVEGEIVIRFPDGRNVASGLEKFSGLLGDFVEVGCQSVLNPGFAVGKNTVIYPLQSVRGAVPSHVIYKTATEIVEKRA